MDGIIDVMFWRSVIYYNHVYKFNDFHFYFNLFQFQTAKTTLFCTFQFDQKITLKKSCFIMTKIHNYTQYLLISKYISKYEHDFTFGQTFDL
jgi:hypothetical protein